MNIFSGLRLFFMCYMRFLLSSVILFFVLPFTAFSQRDSVGLNAIIEKTVKFSTDRPIEKAYLHFDKPYYALGDTVWFKAYLTVDNHLPSPLSKIIYVDVLAGKDSVVKSLKLPVNSGSASGSLVLAHLSFKQGNYRVRAYTNWMFNFKDDYFFYKNLVVGDAIEKQLVTHISFTSTAKSSKLGTNISFKDPKGRPYIDRKVSWKLMDGYDVVSKGRGTTDAKGVLNLNIERSKGDPDKAALVTVMELTSEKNISTTFPLLSVSEKKDVQFFPEGGMLIDGLPSKLAFKAIRANGLGIDVKGTIVDNAGNTISDFASGHAGMGVLTIVPQLNKSYKANVVFPDGSKGVFPLPVVREEGIAMIVNNSDTGSVNIRIAANNKFFEKFKGKTFYIIGKSSGIVCYAAQARLQNQVFTAKIEKDKFPSGITQLTLMSSAVEPLSERLIFIHKPTELSGIVKTDKASYLAKQKVKMDFNLKAGSLPSQGNFSVAVVNESKVPFDENAETTILTSLLLNSDLKGYIEKPNYYFNKTNSKKLQDLDVLLLTQGYRTFSYPEIMTSSYPALSFVPEQGIEISGKLRMKNGMPVYKGNVRLIIPDKSFSASAITDAEGQFRFTNISFNDSSKVTLSAVNNVNSKNMMFMVDGTAFPSVKENINAAEDVLNIDSALSVYLENSKSQYFDFRTLQEVVIKARAEKKPSHADYPALSGLSMMADQEISGERLSGCNNLIQCLPGLAMGLTYIDNNLYLTRSYNQGDRTPVQVYIQDMPVDVSFLATLNPREIESIEVFYKDGLSGINRRNNTNGVVVFNKREVKTVALKADQIKELFPESNKLTFTPQGYSKVRQFYSPKYDVPASAKVKDLRTTIYWNPALLPDEIGNASFEFYNSDGKGTYRAVIEGIDNEGRLGRFVQRFTVK
ncbi:carboxypeptidase-like regulatory domain-containing protein [Desertivirga xinjiangensis]|uniref:carboxypeptidase-like regulatory domain-containing protein n=1 Tax=Desertivirga xinjiangensis TaxID=539206 RepID=UPI00210A9DC2|nr:carboxypeptidase-like regulatory domain-containing protein [Pedobacter xinjiangensis]